MQQCSFKILEEPNDNLFFILIHDVSKKILDTINPDVSFLKTFDLNETISIVNEVIKDDIYNYLNNDFIDNYSTVGELFTYFIFLMKIKLT